MYSECAQNHKVYLFRNNYKFLPLWSLNSGIILKSLREKEEKCTVLHAIKCHLSDNTFIRGCFRDAFSCMFITCRVWHPKHPDCNLLFITSVGKVKIQFTWTVHTQWQDCKTSTDIYIAYISTLELHLLLKRIFRKFETILEAGFRDFKTPLWRKVS
jgi:hypothetical protein